MESGSREGEDPIPSPNEAFDLLGNETRIGILQTLGEADDPIPFTQLRDEVGIRQGAQFNYHLDKLVGHFVSKTDDGYALRRPGRRVVRTIRSGAVTEDPTIEASQIDLTCHHCGALTEVSYRRGEVRLSCTSCGGNYDESVSRGPDPRGDDGNLANFSFPPAGTQGRTPGGVQQAAATWVHLEALAAAGGICAWCAARIESDLRVCENHDAGPGLCDACDRRLAVWVQYECTNCTYDQAYPMVMALLDVPALLAFVGDHGLNTTTRGIEWGWDYDEAILSSDPFKGQFTFSIDGDSITLTVDENIQVVDVQR